MSTSDGPKKPSRRGFAGMDPERRRAIARRGGIACHAQGRGHEWQAGDEARAASRKGVEARARRAKAST